MSRPLARTAAIFAAAALAVSPACAAENGTLKVKVGDPFPAVAVTAAQVEKIDGKKPGDTLGIADLKGKTVVVFFYPRAMTGG